LVYGKGIYQAMLDVLWRIEKMPIAN